MLPCKVKLQDIRHTYLIIKELYKITEAMHLNT